MIELGLTVTLVKRILLLKFNMLAKFNGKFTAIYSFAVYQNQCLCLL